jgi:hypothetical protein
MIIILLHNVIKFNNMPYFFINKEKNNGYNAKFMDLINSLDLLLNLRFYLFVNY